MKKVDKMKKIGLFVIAFLVSNSVISQQTELAKKLLDDVSSKMKAYNNMQLNFSASLSNEEAGINEDDELKFLYNDYTYSSGNSPGLVKHFSEYANNVIKKYNPEKNSLVVDVGSNDGTLLNFFKQNRKMKESGKQKKLLKKHLKTVRPFYVPAWKRNKSKIWTS